MINNKLLKSAAGAGGITPSDNFSVKLYNGNGSSQSIDNGLNLSSDGGLVWIKDRLAGGEWHVLTDSVRGTNSQLFSNESNTQDTKSTVVTAFNTDGFSVGSDNLVNRTLSGSNGSYVSWSFKGGGTASDNNDGSITSSVSANVAAGFSICTYSGASTTSTVGHGLSSPPELVIVKGRTVTAGWPTLYNDGSNSYAMRLNSNAANDNGNKNLFFGNGSSHIAPTSSVFTVGNSDETNQGYNYVAYCFHSVAGYSKIGEFDGTGTTSGNFVETGFEPAFLLIKRHNSTGVWVMLDNKRNLSNPRNSSLYSNTSAAEDTGSSSGYYPVNFFTTGFQTIQDTGDINASGGKYIYMAFAADPDTTTPTLASSFSIHNYTGTGATTNILTSSLKTSGEIALYDFNTTTLTDDKTGNYSGGTNNNVTRNTSDKKFGDSSAEFNGSTADIDLEAGLDSSTMSVSFWIKIDSTITNSGVVIELENGYGVWFLASAAGKLGMQSSNGNSQHTLSNAQLSASTWHHVAAVWNSGSRTFYINNATQSGGTVADYLTCDENTLGSRRSGEFFDGRLDQVRFYNYALDAGQVGYLYAETGNEVYRKPDFVWIKSRSEAGHHALFDTLRGTSMVLASNQAGAEIDRTSNQAGVSAFLDNGFTVNDPGGSGENYYVNQDGVTYVAWVWKMLDNNNDNPVLIKAADTNATIDSLVSANTLSGQSIVQWTGDGNASSLVAHGLSSAPLLILVKNMTTAKDWVVYSSVLDTGKNLALNAGNAQYAVSSATSSGGLGTPNAETISFIQGTSNVDNANKSGDKYIAYCFHNITSYQKIGSYTGNGSGQDITNFGFDPDFVLVKSLDSSAAWRVIDSVRGNNTFLYPSLDNAQDTGTYFSLITDGIRLNGLDSNQNGEEFLYWALKIN
jgi:hypothetical protein